MSRKNVEAVYPLSPLQEGMLFHTLEGAERGVYHEQVSCLLRGDLDRQAFAAAWQLVVDRHPILRTAFVWEGVKAPLQVVGRRVRLPLVEEDWRALSPQDQRQRWKTMRAADRERGFKLAKAPLMRLTLIHLGADRHRFLWSHHHLLLDGWSLPLVLRDVLSAYEALRHGEAPTLPPARPYADYIAWLRHHAPQQAAAFWRRELTGFTAPTPLGMGDEGLGTRDATAAFGARRASLAADEAARLEAFARRHHLTLNTLTQAAWSLLLARYSGTPDVLFGITVSGRPPELPGVESMVGLFINTLPLRVRAAPRARLLPWLTTLQRRQVALRQYEHSPLVAVHGWSEVPRGRALFESLLVFESYPVLDAGGAAARNGALRVAEVETDERTNYPLTLVAATPGGGLTLRLLYDAARFTATEIARLLGHLATLLDAFSRRPDAVLEALPMLRPAERHQLLHEVAGGTATFPHPAGDTLHGRFAVHAARQPDAVALSAAPGHLTYGALDRAAEQLARRLRLAGVGPETVVGLALERSPALVVAILGILKAGGAYLPLDPDLPASRLDFMQRDGRAALVVTRAAHRQRFAAQRAVIAIDEPVAAGPMPTPAPAPVPATASNLAYVIYTSGSTGTPKGTPITHGNVLRLLDATAAWFRCDRRDVWTLFHAYAFDFSVWELWGALALGGRLVVVAYWVSRTPRRFLALLRRQRVTILNQTPSAFRPLLAAAEEAGGRLALRRVIFGGEALAVGDLVPWLQRGSAEVPGLVNMYGITETTVHVTYRPLSKQDVEHGGAASPIGVPIPDLRLHVLDPEGNLLPLGVSGELHVGGPGLARGYLDRPGLTASRFVPDPFSEGRGERLYRSGDRVRRTVDGQLVYLGRADDQLKLRGFRIEPGEIEAVLSRQPAVREAAVVARGEGAERHLVAYVVPRQEASEVDAAALRTTLAAALPAAMVPAFIVSLAALPLTANGKLDRRALPAPDAGTSRAAAGPEDGNLPRRPVEEILAGIWSDVLGIEAVEKDDDFFALGGHSLLAIRVAARVRDTLGLELPLQTLFAAPTLGALARRLEAMGEAEATGGAEVAAPPPLRPREGEGDAPLSFAQERLWFLEALDPGAAHVIPTAVRLRGNLRAAALEAALARVVGRHAILRTRFPSHEGQPVQQIDDDVPLVLPRICLRALPAARREEEAARWAHADARRGFDLARGPLLRAALLQLADDHHILLLSQHHIVADGWSVGILIRELATLYQAAIHSRPSPLPPLPIQYADFAVWQRAWLDDAARQAQLAYWRRALSAATLPLELPTDRPRPAVHSLRAARRPVALPAELVTALRALGRRRGTTLFMTLLAAFQVFLGRHADRRRFTIGTPVAGRDRLATEGLIGCFVNTLVLPADLGGDPPFHRLLQRVRTAALGAYAHQDLPFEQLVEALNPRRDLSRTPLFQVMLALQNAPLPALALSELDISPLGAAAPVARYELTLDLAERGGGLAGVLEYGADLFDATTAERLLQSLTTLLQAVSENDKHRLSALPLLRPPARHQLLHAWNDSARSPAEEPIHRVVAAWATTTPDAVAVVMGTARWTYRQLDAEVSLLAHRLRDLGVGPEVPVALFLERAFTEAVAVLGVLAAGGAFLPLDTAAPPARLAGLLTQSGTPLVLTEAGLRGRLPAFDGRVLVLEPGAEPTSTSPPTSSPTSPSTPASTPLPTTIPPQQLAYVIFTSGSSGEPKGVMVSHGSLANRLLLGRTLYPLAPGEGGLHQTSLTFDVAIWELFAPLLEGGRLVLARPGGQADGAYLADLLATQRVALAGFVPSVLGALVAQPALPACRALRYLTSGGETLPPELVRRFFRLPWPGPTPRFFNCYGPTEAAIDTTFHGCTAGEPALRVPIGRPLPNVRVQVRDRAGHAAPMGVPGTLHIAGSGLARGYLGQPRWTAARFVPDAASPRPGGRLYDSGDQALLRPDGAVDFLGRRDHQVKLRGQRIELGEVEAALLRQDGVAEAVATVWQEGEDADRRLVAHVLPAPGASLAPAVLRSRLATALPAALLPSHLIVVDELPRLPGGKVDRQALPAPEVDEAPPPAAEAPRGPVEEIVAAIWAAVLGGPPPGRDSSFFDLGGHSLLATRVVSQLRLAFGVELPLRDLFAAPTVAALAAQVEAARRQDDEEEAPPPLVRAPRRGSLPLSFAQQRLWLLDQLTPGDPAYNVASAVELSGELDRGALAGALGQVQQRHEALRTTFPSQGGTPRQLIHPPALLAVPLVDLGALGAGPAAMEARRLAAWEARQPFDLALGPLLRATLVRLAPRRHVALLTLHHIVSDGWSAGILVDELAAFYTARRERRAPALSPLPLHYGDFARWQRQWLEGGALDRQLTYWRQRLAGLPERLTLPTDRPYPARRGRQAGTVDLLLSAPLTTALRQLSRDHRATLFMVLLAGFQALPGRLSGQRDVAVGTPIAGRNRAEIEGLIGFFVNTLVLRTDLGGGPDGATLLRRVRDTALDAYAHQELPFERLVEALAPARSLQHSPLFQVMLVLQNAPTGSRGLPGLTLRPLGLGAAAAKYDLTLTLVEGDEHLAGVFTYAADLFDGVTIQRLAGHLERLLAGLVADPGGAVAALPLLGAGARHQLMVAWNDSQRQRPGADGTLPGLVAARAAASPDATAVIGADGCLSYGALAAQAAQLAAALAARGIGAEARVGVMLPPSCALAVAALGTMMAGAVYVPLEAADPAPRLAFLSGDAGLAALVTDRGVPAAARDAVPAAQLFLAASSPALRRPSGGLAKRFLDPAAAAYIIYTSGSTGQPKGVVVPHRGVVSRLLWSVDAFALGSGGRVLQSASPRFDFSLWELFAPLVCGATVLLAPEPVRADSAALAAYIRRQRITVAHFVPSLLAAFLDVVATDPCPSLRHVQSGGEPLPRHLALRHLTLLPAARLHNQYGPTEAAIDVSFETCRPNMPAPPPQPDGVPIGRPMDHCRLHVLDAALRPLPIGVVGELAIAGRCLARGYLGRPARTATAFCPDPFAQQPGARLYRSGDRARLLPDGRLLHLGRIDHQVKVRGFRIELGEVEAALAAHPALAETAVAVDAVGEAVQLVAYLRSRSQPPPTAGALRAFLAARLPAFMLPARFVLLDALPRTTSGKVDRRALAAAGGAAAAQSTAHIPPRTPREATLTAIWARVLGKDGSEEVGIRDNFFELGGDSILGIQVVARARQAGLALTPRQLFEHQTIAELAAVASEAPAVAAEQGAVTGAVPLTPIQHRFFAQQQPDRHHYNQAVMLASRAVLAPAALAVAVARLLVHHDALRLRFTRRAEGWQQRLAPPGGPPPFTLLDLAALPAAAAATARGRAAAALQASLDLGHGPLLRAALFAPPAGQPARLLLAIHHLAVDAVSWPILLADLATLYDQAATGRPPALPAKTTSFKAWAERLVAHARSPALEAERAFWRAAAAHPPVPLPRLPGGGPNLASASRTAYVTLDAEATTALLEKVPAAYRTRIDEVLLCALVEALAPWTGSRRLWVDLEGHGREDVFTDVDVSRTVGWFTSVFPLHLDLSNHDDPGAALKAVKEQLRAVPRRGFGYGLLRFPLPPEPEVSFNYLGQLDRALDGDALLYPAAEGAGPDQSPRTRRRYLLEVGGGIAGGQLRMGFAYSPQHHGDEEMEALAARFLTALRRLVRHGSDPRHRGYTPSDFPLAGLDGATLDRLTAGDPGVEDLYPLSPLQEGLLFHTLADTGTAPYFEQLTCRLDGRLDPAALRGAWNGVVARHPILRSVFLWEGLDRPLQQVRRWLPPGFALLDWSALPAAEGGARFHALLAADRSRGFDLARGPLLRLTLLRLGPNRHRLVLSHHHLLLDGWSLSLLLQEVFARYDARTRAETPAATPVRPYRHYIAWLARQSLVDAEAFWRRTLAGFTNPTPLGIDRAPTPEAADANANANVPERYATVAARLSAADSAALTALARRHALTLNTLAQGAWALLLGRYSGAGEVVFGVTVAGRPAELPGVETMIGLFINTLPARIAVPRNGALLPWLRQLQAAQAELRQYEHSPLAAVRGWSTVPREQALFESLFIFENYPAAEAVADREGELAVLEVDAFERTNYPLTLAAAPGRRLAFLAVYDRLRFDPSTMLRLRDHYLALLAAMAADPHRTLGALPWLAPAETQQIVVEAADTAGPYAAAFTFHQLVARRAAAAPDAAAVIADSVMLTYGGLVRRAGHLAQRLRALGVEPEARVGLAMGRSPALVVGLLAILEAGGAFVPLDPAYPAARLRFMLTDAAVVALLTEEAVRAALPATTVPVVTVDGRALEAGPRQTDPSPPTADNLAYLIYTSGSTGQPKGVQLAHRGWCALAAAQQVLFDLEPTDRVLQFSALSFDAAVWEVAMALVPGAALVLGTAETLLPGPELTALLARQRVTTVTLPPSALAVLPAAPLPALRRLITAGEASPAALAARWGRGRGFWNAYGPTEATVCASAARCPPGARQLSIGRPIRNTTVYLAAGDLRPVPRGIAGELLIGGLGVARGYHRRPALSAAVFVPDPFGRGPGARLYKSGDLARQRPDGQLDFLGRFDQQVKVRGFRVEPGEVESALLRLPAVGEAAVLARAAGTAQHRQLVAYVVPRAGQQLDVDALSHDLGHHLPRHLVPTLFHPLAALPRLPNGKVDRRALPAIVAGHDTARAPFQPPRGGVERRLAAIWSGVLGVERVGRDDDFFALGGDSILSIQVVSRARQAGLQLMPRQVFEQPTLAALAGAAGTVARVAAEQGAVSGSLPLTPIQHWFFAQPLPTFHHFNQALLLTVQGVEARIVRAALARLLRHHDALRLRFASTAAGWLQEMVMPDDGVLPLTHVDLAALPAARRRTALEKAAAAAQGSLDLAAGPLLRALFLEVGDAPRLFLAIHHLAVDGVSWRILLEDLSTLCQSTARQALAAGAAPILPPKTTSFKAWAERLNAHARTAELDAEAGYWLATTRAASPLPVDEPAGRNLVVATRSCGLRLDREATAALLREVPAAYGTKIEEVLLTALVLALNPWIGGEALRVDLEGHGREPLFDDVDLSRTVGWLTSLYPVRLEVAGGEPGAALEAVKEALRAVPHRGLGYGLLRYLRRPEEDETARRLAAMPAAEMSFNYLGQLDSALSTGRDAAGAGDGDTVPRLAPAPESPGPSSGPGGLRSHLLAASGRITGGQLHLDLAYAATLHRRRTVEALVAAWRDALLRLIDHCRAPQSSGYTPADFPLAGLDQAALDRLGGGRRGDADEIEDLYPLSPLQQGMLLHTLQARARGASATAGCEQVAATLDGELDRRAFRQAWQETLDRHPALRTAFVWREVPVPLQRVWRRLTVPWYEVDLRALPASAAHAHFAAFLAADRGRGFDPAVPPLLRLILVHTAHGLRFVWSFHHLLLDGWSGSLILGDVLALYAALRQERAARLASAPPYRDYIAWLGSRDEAAEERFWRHTLDGFTAPSRLLPGRVSKRLAPGESAPGESAPGESAPGEGQWGTAERAVPTAATAQLEAFARRHRLTLGTLVQGAWALLVGHHGRARRVLFGATVAGRPAELPGVESMVGLFINTVPIAVTLDGAASVGAWLRALQAHLVAVRRHEAAPLAAIEAWSAMPRGLPLFDNLLVFENYPVEEPLRTPGPGLRVREVRTEVRANYPLTLVVQPGPSLALRLTYDRRRVEGTQARRLLAQLETLLTGLAGDADRPLGTLSPLSAAEHHQLTVAWPAVGLGRLLDAEAHAFTPPPDAVGVAIQDGDGKPAAIGVAGALVTLAATGQLAPTGLMARWQPDGRLCLLGRADELGAIQGMLVEPATIETALAAHPAVADVAVLRREKGPGHGQLAAYLTARDGAALEVDALRRWARERLPAPWRPALYQLLDTLPLDGDGRLDPAALPPVAEYAPAPSAEAPRDHLERALAQLMASTLGSGPVGRHDNFFALGGHSLLAVHLAAAIHRQLGRELPLSVLIEHGTVAALAAHLRQAPGAQRGPLVRLQPAGTAAPFFCVHPAGGSVFAYAELARLLGDAGPFYGVEARGLAAGETPFDDLEAMAGHYVKALQGTAPGGPFLLGGWSLGGLVAYEMARQLTAAGESVGLLALLDTAAVLPTLPAGYDDADYLADLAGELLPVSAAELRQRPANRRLPWLVEQAAAAGRLPAGFGLQEAERLLRVFKHHGAAARRYTLRPYPGRLTLFRSAATPPRSDATLGWAALAGEVEVEVIPGAHHELVRPPHVHILAARLRSALEQARGGSG